MAEEWFYAHEGNEFGPFSSAQLKRLAASGQIQPTDLVWKAGVAKRVPARAVKGLCPASAPAAQLQPAAAHTPSQPVPSPQPAAEEPVELTAVDFASAPTQDFGSLTASTQVEDEVELTAVEPAPLPPPPVAPSPPQPHYPQPPAPAYPTPPAAPPVHSVPVSSRTRAPEPRDENRPRRERPRRRHSGGSRLWVWLLLGGMAVLITGGVTVILLVALNQSRATPENFAKVKRGMSESEVTRILGTPDLKVGLGNIKTLAWRNGGNVYQVLIQDGQVAHMNSMPFEGDLDGLAVPPANFNVPNPGGVNFPRPGGRR
jgi:hypothetical protein